MSRDAGRNLVTRAGLKNLAGVIEVMSAGTFERWIENQQARQRAPPTSNSEGSERREQACRIGRSTSRWLSPTKKGRLLQKVCSEGVWVTKRPFWVNVDWPFAPPSFEAWRLKMEQVSRNDIDPARRVSIQGAKRSRETDCAVGSLSHGEVMLARLPGAFRSDLPSWCNLRLRDSCNGVPREGIDRSIRDRAYSAERRGQPPGKDTHEAHHHRAVL